MEYREIIKRKYIEVILLINEKKERYWRNEKSILYVDWYIRRFFLLCVWVFCNCVELYNFVDVNIWGLWVFLFFCGGCYFVDVFFFSFSSKDDFIKIC